MVSYLVVGEGVAGSGWEGAVGRGKSVPFVEILLSGMIDRKLGELFRLLVWYVVVYS